MVNPKTNKPPAKKKTTKVSMALSPYQYDDWDTMIEAINDETAIVLVQGKTFFVRIPELDRAELNLYRQSDMRAWLGRHHWLYGTSTAPKQKPAFDAWLTSDKANRFEGLVFNPAEGRIIDNGNGGELLNRFVGLGLDFDQTATGTYHLFRELVETLMCHGEQELIDFTWNFMAQIIQEPERKVGVSLMIRGDKGTGKSTFSNVMAHLIGERYSPVVDSADAFTGRFSGHLEHALLIRLEEGYHAANPSHESRLKSLISGKKIPIERKGLDGYNVDHYARIIMTSNSDHVVPATGGERRFVCLDISPQRKQDGAFFAAMAKELENGGYAQLFRDLSKRDLTGCDWANPPLTAGLSSQIRLSMKPDEAWWADLLTSGAVAFTRTPEMVQDEALEWSWDEPFLIERAALYESYRQFAPGFRSPPSPATLGRFLKQVCPQVEERRTGKQGHQTRCYVLPPRRQALEAFEIARPGLSLTVETTERLNPSGEARDVAANVLPFNSPPARRAA